MWLAKQFGLEGGSGWNKFVAKQTRLCYEVISDVQETFGSFMWPTKEYLECRGTNWRMLPSAALPLEVFRNARNRITIGNSQRNNSQNSKHAPDL